MKQKVKNLRPIEYDIHLKYQCLCSQIHWLSYNEASEPDFIIVCDCGKKLKVKPVKDFSIEYKKKKKKKRVDDSSESTTDSLNQTTTENNKIIDKSIIEITNELVDTTTIEIDLEKDVDQQINNIEETEIKPIPPSLLKTCSNLLVTFGYNKREAVEVVKNFYYYNIQLDQSNFVKELLIHIGRS